ncbi:MAG: RNA 2',3'-cyclic phosphodiesterase [Actinomycetota bacterium]|nr:RNA 2',3'-cyclic phosphodiesterase [Actinomycetota bacterium]
MATARLFVAVWPPDDVVALLAALDRPEVVGLRWTPQPHWHVTLRFLGRADVDDARRALGDLIVPEAPVVAVVGPVVGRFGQRVLQVPVSGLDGLAAAVVRATAGVGEPPDDRPFAGHVTLARASLAARVDLGRLTGQTIAGSWSVTEVSLVESRLSSAGATYEEVERRSLTT